MKMKTLRADDSMIHVALAGRLDVQGVNEIQYEFHQLTTVAPRPTIVDISGVSYIGSLGLGMLISAAKYLQKSGIKLVLLRPTATVKTAFEVAGLHHVIPVAGEEPAALQLLR